MKDVEKTLLRSIAVVLVALRSRCIGTDGRTDWVGRSADYRGKAQELYRQANIPEDSQDTIQGAVRYHIGNILRDELSAEELEDYGLKTLSPVARGRERRASRAAIVTVARAELAAADVGKKSKKAAPAVEPAAPSSSGSLVADHLRLSKGAATIISQLSTDIIDGMTDGQRAKLDEELEAAQKAIARLRRHSRRRSAA
ncbi:hypothetical protein [Streptomyces sp. NRRL S-378]|uniref:hypothetical protein n=1 Tax=Streptomyces sp. NRRL S-378 TaxID=1463904 RepID=UPI0004C82D3A|nr:hypothetical protein [Streptomyces sp. NRRL S-378]